MIGQWGLMRRLRRGTKLMLFLTYKCNLKCEYCSLGYTGKKVHSEMIGLVEWKKTIEAFPLKLREIRISGGEPMLMSYYAELINWLIDRGLYVLVFSNFTILNLDVKPSSRLVYSTTYHKGADPEKWKRNLKEYQRKYKVVTHQLADNTIDGVRVGAIYESERGYTCVGFMCNPAGKLYTGFMQMLEGDNG